ncbi:hypothetical protein AKJ61_02935 [candidate division MSBL1 archaeon SCGC-AAA259B11]|uniref:Uncharacterized protein n=1 Tax=candidate division MSBL1 archaeon SCGC-AAA259B11 TaxID=1698260 RepID=A0A133U5H8_9EURY|nr:hypothetical protein AKJ61_02935 [candidate division MSBL1 archaeon SCGC-AAA259B11]
MFRNPFDEFRRLEMLIRRMLETDYPMESSGGSVSIRKINGKTKIDIRGDVPDSTIRRLRRKYPNAGILIGEKGERTSKSPTPVVEEVEEPETRRHSEDVNPRKLALKRFREKKEKQHEDPASEKGEDR